VRHYAAIEFTWTARPAGDRIDTLLARLDDGSLSAVDDQGLVWRVFFDSADARDRALASLAGVEDAATARPVDVADEGWAERSQAAIGAVRAGRVVVAPPWRAGDSLTREAGVDHVIIINPSMGFGTGHHASTRLCLSLLQALPLAGRSVLDVGTGSGVLAIAAWRLGASLVDAIDVDRDALDAARDSLDRNGAGRAVRLIAADLADVARRPDRRRYDVLVANLTGTALIQHAAALAALGAPEGSLIAGGLEADESGAVAGALERAGWQAADRKDEDGWVGLRLVRRATSPSASTAR
jgi:ribosomal protein L11 methyltransferase